jgi:hypothetical protein
MSPLARICAGCRRPVPVDQLKEGRCGDCYRGHARARNQRRGNRVWQSHRWRKVGEQVLARDGHPCRRCGRPGNTVHHLEGFLNEVDPAAWDPTRCITLWRSCHGSIDAPKASRRT